MRCDALVIGGGPAGAASAIRLARAGHPVVVLEKASFPRRKVCGELVAGSGIRELEALGLGERFHAVAGPPVRRVALWLAERALHAPLPQRHGAARALERDRLDALLLDRARDFGAEILQPARAVALRRGKAGFICEAAVAGSRGSTQIEARVVVDAGGSWRPPGELLGFQAHFRDVRLAPGTIALVPFPGGYAGLVERSAGRATLACCVRRAALDSLRLAGRSAGDSLLEHLREHCAELRRALADAKPDGPWLAAGPLQPGVRPRYRDGVFAVGNAAGEAHPLIGEGLAMALGSAALLCERLAPALHSAFNDAKQKEVAKQYSAAWSRQFRLRLWTSARLAQLAMRPSAAALAERMLAPAPRLLAVAARLSGK